MVDSFKIAKRKPNKIADGKAASVRLYPSSSSFEDKAWTVSIILSKSIMYTAVKCRSRDFVYIIFGLLLAGIAVFVLFSRQYLWAVDNEYQKKR